MKLRSYAAVILGSAVLVSHTPAIAQMTPVMAEPKMTMPAESPAPEMPADESSAIEQPMTEKPAETDAPAAETPTATPMAPIETPVVESSVEATPEIVQPAPTEANPEAIPLPTLETPTTTPILAPSATMPTGPAPAAMTKVLPEESITGIAVVSMPEPSPIQAGDFTLPIALKVAQDANAVSSTPISDRYTGKANWNLAAWTTAVRSCMQQKPKLVRVVGEQEVPFMLNGEDGTVMLNANGKAVCPM